MKNPFGRRKMCFFVRINDGVSLIHFDRENDSPVEEAVNTLGLSAGLTYPVWKELSLGFELGYQAVFTAEDVLQGMCLTLIAEYRI